jgi:O-6-methylguanine DNA methyltransferase
MSLKEKVFQVVKNIKRGSFLSYKEVAKRAGKEKAYRVVANILKNSPENVPCHRVIRNDNLVGGYMGREDLDWLKAALLLKEGAIGVIPTDTIYGICASAFNRKSVEKVYKLRKRNPNKPCIILISSFDDLKKFNVKLNFWQRKILEKLWPGKISVILNTRTYADYTRTNADKRNLPGFSPDTIPGYKPGISENSPGLRPDKLTGFKPDISGNHPGNISGRYPGKLLSNISGNHPVNNVSLRKSASSLRKSAFEYLHRGTNSLSFRLTKNKLILNILKISGPIIAPSANWEGHEPAKNIRSAKRYFGNKVFYLDRGNLISKPSTLIDLRKKKIKILREGEEIRKVF